MSVKVKCKCRLTLRDAEHLLNTRVHDFVRKAGPYYLVADIRGFLKVTSINARVRKHNVEVLLRGDLPVPVLVYNGAGREEWVDLHNIPATVKAKKDFFLYPRVNGIKKMSNLLAPSEHHDELQSEYLRFENSWCETCHGKLEIGSTVQAIDEQWTDGNKQQIGESGCITFTPAK